MRAACLLAAALSAPARAGEDEIISRQALYGLADLRAVAIDGEAGWADGGFGKLRFGSDDSLRLRPRLAEGTLAWRPRFGWSTRAMVSLSIQDGQDRLVDIGEAFVQVRPSPVGDTRLGMRLGLLYPPVSLEHSGPAWSVTNSITPSAINSWIGEEVKLVAAEASAMRGFGAHELTLTAAAFGFNDTSGTLLSFRGWALHDLKATALSHMPLPPLSPATAPYQAPHSNPVNELDSRVGYYVKLGWRPPVPLGLELFRYDNRGDGVSSRSRQTSWATRFWNLGATAELGERTHLVTQLLTGDTRVGDKGSAGAPLDVRYRAAFLLAVHDIDQGAVSARVDLFDTKARSFGRINEDYGETGWAAMLALRRPVSGCATLLAELLHVSSKREGREYLVVEEHQGQTQVQLALRLTL